MTRNPTAFVPAAPGGLALSLHLELSLGPSAPAAGPPAAGPPVYDGETELTIPETLEEVNTELDNVTMYLDDLASYLRRHPPAP